MKIVDDILVVIGAGVVVVKVLDAVLYKGVVGIDGVVGGDRPLECSERGEFV